MKIRKIVRPVRKHLEKMQADFKLWDDACGGMCAIGSVLSFIRLKEAGLEPRIALTDVFTYKHESYNHAFILVDDRIVDVVATQFNEPRICIRLQDRTKQQYWTWKLSIYSCLATMAWAIEDWPERQNPFSDLIGNKVKRFLGRPVQDFYTLHLDKQKAS